MAENLDSLDVVSFAAGGFRFAVQACQVRGMLAEGAPGAIAAEALIGLAPPAGAPRRLLVVGGRGACVEVGEPVELEALPAASLFPLPPPVAARISLSGIKGVAVISSGIVLIVDLEAILPPV